MGMNMRPRPNPAMQHGFKNAGAGYGGATMTLDGVVVKTATMLGLVAASGAVGWTMAGTGAGIGLAVGGLLVALVAGLVLTFKPHTGKFLAPVYAVGEGLVLGWLSSLFNGQYPGIALTAVGLTVTVAVGLLVAYSTRLIRPSENFKLGVFAATAGVALFYLAAIVLRMFGIQMPLIHDNGLLGIAFSLFVVCLAAANLVVDFDFIEEGVTRGAPKHMEWYAAYGLVVTLVWLYLELLRLLAKLQSSDD
jgi:uncharacterized YccA/Bax inhibitor family protein